MLHPSMPLLLTKQNRNKKQVFSSKMRQCISTVENIQTYQDFLKSHLSMQTHPYLGVCVG